MNVVTHVLAGWCLAEAFPGLRRREKALVTFGAVAPDLDGLGAIAELATEHSATPLLWWTEYHHVVGHNLLFAACFALIAAVLARTARARTGIAAFVAVHTHIFGDVLGSRGPDEYQWPIPYLYPFRDEPRLVWAGQWYLNAWPNIAITGVLIALTCCLAWRRGYSIVALFSARADREFVNVLRRRFGGYASRNTGTGCEISSH